MRKTKIVCTIGPSTESPEMVEKMILAGMNVGRMNFSHGGREEHHHKVVNIRNASKKLGLPCSVLLDTKGPEIRCGVFENGRVDFEANDEALVVKEDVIGNHERFTLSCKELFNDIQVGNTILIDDGKMNLTVTEVYEDSFKVRFNNPGPLKTKKGVNVPGVKLSMPFVSEKDREDILYAAEVGFDYIALSFVRRASDVLAVRELLKDSKKRIQLIAKIENQEGYDNLAEILEVADGIMVARGDLGVEVSTELVPLYQKNMIRMANNVGKPAICATHMLESMINCPRPTRAEASDVCNAILDGCDAVMLSGESAVGSYPIEAVRTLNNIAEITEKQIPHQFILSALSDLMSHSINDAIGITVSQCALNLDSVGAIVAFTQTGGTARRISKFRPRVPILACTDSQDSYDGLNLQWGTYPELVDFVEKFDEFDEVACRVAKKYGVMPGSKIILTSGYKEEHGTTNTIRIIEVK